MGGWLLALASGAFWAGMLLSGSAGEAVLATPAVVLLAAGPVSLAVLSAWRRAPGAHVLARLVALVLVWASFLCMGSGFASLALARVRASPLASSSGVSVRVWGVLDSAPRQSPRGWRASLRAESFARQGDSSGWRVRDLLWLEGEGRRPALDAEDRVAVAGVMRRPRGGFGAFLSAARYAGALSVERVYSRGPPSNPFVRAAEGLRSRLRASVHSLFPEREAGLLMGLAIGDTSTLNEGVAEDFRASGLTHLVAVSGGNLAMFLAPVLFLTMLVPLGPRVRFAVGILSIAFFALLTRAEPSVLRASAMAGLAMLGAFLGRPGRSPALVGGAVLVLLVWDPRLARDVGFALSVGATVGIAMFAAPLAERLRFLPRPLAIATGATAGAQLAVAPLILDHFGVVPASAIPANLLAFPAVGPAMLLGLAAGIAGIAFGPLGEAVAGIAKLPLIYLELVADRLARAPLPSVTSGTSGTSTTVRLFVGLVVVGLLAWWIRSHRPLPRRALILAILAVPAFVWGTALRAGPPSALEVTFFDVGQGDAALVRSPGGASILIDGGPDPDLVAAKLAAVGVRRLDALVATHPHADHVAGLAAVLARVPVALVLEPGCRDEAPEYAEFKRAVEESGAAVRHPRVGTSLGVGDVRVDVLSPRSCFRGTDSDVNNDSLVLRVSLGRDSVLFTGDAEEPAQQEMLALAPGVLRASVLKVPHHGGATSLDRFLLAVRARVAVVSVGPNRYGHPVPTVMSVLARGGARVIRTDRAGDLSVSLGEGELAVASSGS